MLNFANNFGNIYMVFPFRVSVADVTTRKECFKPFFFFIIQIFPRSATFRIEGNFHIVLFN